MRYLLLILTLTLLGIASCATNAEVGRNFNVTTVGEFKRNVTTKEEVQRALGKPSKTEISPDGKEVWSYYHEKTSVSSYQKRILFGLPGVITTSSQIKEATLTFYGNTLVDFKVTQSSE